MTDIFTKEQRAESLQWLIGLFETTPTRADEVTEVEARLQQEKEKGDHGTRRD
jgi:hypothetical protein